MKKNAGLLFCIFFAAGFGLALPNASAAMQELPKGSYQYSCIGCIRNMDMLNCSCPDNNGQIKPANIHLASCNREISNRDGKLVCGG